MKFFGVPCKKLSVLTAIAVAISSCSQRPKSLLETQSSNPPVINTNVVKVLNEVRCTPFKCVLADQFAEARDVCRKSGYVESVPQGVVVSSRSLTELKSITTSKTYIRDKVETKTTTDANGIPYEDSKIVGQEPYTVESTSSAYCIGSEYIMQASG